MWHKPTKGLKPLWIQRSLFSWESECCVGLVFCPLMFLDSQAFFNPFSCFFHTVPLCKSTALQESKRCESVWAMAPSLGMYEQWHHASEFLGIKKWRNELWLSTNLRWPLENSCPVLLVSRRDHSPCLSGSNNWSPSFSGNWNFNERNASIKGIDSMSPMVPPSSIMPRQNKNMAAICSMTKTCSYINLSHSTCPSHFHVCRSKSREWIAMLCHTCETLVYEYVKKNACIACINYIKLYLHISIYLC